MEYIIEDTKTSSGTRDVPMTSEVAECFHRIINKRKKVKVEPMIDGYSGFLYLDKNNMPMVALHWEKYFQHVVEKYNGSQRRDGAIIKGSVLASCTEFNFTTFDGKFTTFYAKKRRKSFCRKCAANPVKSRKTEDLQYYDKNTIHLPWKYIVQVKKSL